MHADAVVVTGLGVVSAAGRDTTAFWDAIVAGRSAIAPLDNLDLPGLRAAVGAQVRYLLREAGQGSLIVLDKINGLSLTPRFI